jgi:hypothetical protein
MTKKRVASAPTLNAVARMAHWGRMRWRDSELIPDAMNKRDQYDRYLRIFVLMTVALAMALGLAISVIDSPQTSTTMRREP